MLLVQTPYGKDNPLGGGYTNRDPFLVERGYIQVIADIRGTGDSQGTWGLFDPVQQTDGVALADWAASLPHSSGKVGLEGGSYLGIDQLLTAEAAPADSPIKAIFPVVSATDVYRDTSFMGGLEDTEFDAAFLGAITPALNTANPVVDTPTDPTATSVSASHEANIAAYNAAELAQLAAGGPDSFDDAYWTQRAPSSGLAKIVENKIPAYLVGGEFDIFQRGEPLNFAALQNLYDGRPAYAPMTPEQPLTGRYQLIDAPITHDAAGTLTLDLLHLEWYDTWLKGENTGMGSTPTPLHYYDLGTDNYANSTTFPFSGSAPTRWYLGPGRSGTATSLNDGTLSTDAPATDGGDTVAWTPAGNPCSRSTDDWGIGIVTATAAGEGDASNPCLENDQASALGPFDATYTSAAFTAPRTLAGPISASIYAASTTADTELVVTVEDVAADGTSRPLTEGALDGDLRAVDTAHSWPAPDGQYLLPAHDYTAASANPVTPGTVTRYDIEVFPTYDTIAVGHRIRITISTADTPHLTANTVQAAALAGGVYTLERTAAAPSSLELPFLNAAAPAAATSTPASSARHPVPQTVRNGGSKRSVRSAARPSLTPDKATSPSRSLATTGASPLTPLAALGSLLACITIRRRRRTGDRQNGGTGQPRPRA